jgi:peroxiredoxin Q/BCP
MLEDGRRFMAKAPQLELQVGDEAPGFAAPTNGGRTLSLSDLIGKHVVLYFYPKDDTPGCTKEACGFRDAFAQFERKGAVVLGVSTDSVRAHDRFVEKHGLPFRLVADESRSIVKAYGVWGEKRFMGRKYLGTHRATFLIGPDGRIKGIWPNVKPEEHAAEVLAAI